MALNRHSGFIPVRLPTREDSLDAPAVLEIYLTQALYLNGDSFQLRQSQGRAFGCDQVRIIASPLHRPADGGTIRTRSTGPQAGPCFPAKTKKPDPVFVLTSSRHRWEQEVWLGSITAGFYHNLSSLGKRTKRFSRIPPDLL
jgi:hypothetical protein